MAKELLQIVHLPLLLTEQNGQIHHTAHKNPQLLFHVRLLQSHLHKLVFSTLNPSTPSPHYLLYFSNKHLSAFPLLSPCCFSHMGRHFPEITTKPRHMPPSNPPLWTLYYQIWFGWLARNG